MAKRYPRVIKGSKNSVRQLKTNSISPERCPNCKEVSNGRKNNREDVTLHLLLTILIFFIFCLLGIAEALKKIWNEFEPIFFLLSSIFITLGYLFFKRK